MESTRFFYKQSVLITQPQRCLTFSWIGLQVFLRCYLIDVSILILRHFLYLLYLRPCLDLQSYIGYLRQTLVSMWNSAVRKNLNCHFFRRLLLALAKISFWGEDWSLGNNSMQFLDFLMFHNGQWKICSPIKKSQSIMNMIVVLFMLYV